MFKLRPTKETITMSTDVTTGNPDLPAGYDDEESPLHVPAELRPYYVPAPTDHAAAYGDQGQQWTYSRRLDAEVDRLIATDPATYGPYTRAQIRTGIQSPENGSQWRALAEDPVTPDEAEAYVHHLRLRRAHEAHYAEQAAADDVAKSTCRVCGDRPSGYGAVSERTLLDGRKVRADRDCATILDDILRAQARTADGRTREQAAQDWLDQ